VQTGSTPGEIDRGKHSKICDGSESKGGYDRGNAKSRGTGAVTGGRRSRVAEMLGSELFPDARGVGVMIF